MTDDDREHRTFLPIVCDHGANKAAADALMTEVTRRLARGSDTFVARPVAPEAFLYDVLMSLAHDLGGHVDHISADMWFSVTASRWTADYDNDIVHVQCDRPEYGLAAIWRHWADEKGLAVDPVE